MPLKYNAKFKFFKILLVFFLIFVSGSTLSQAVPFPTTYSSLFHRKKTECDIITLGYIYIEITQAVDFHIFYHSCRDYLKSSTNVGNTLSESSSPVVANRAFHL